ncbi:hypothetical protein NECAME_00418 [Necator americanus]|uniref:Uncharacterized protein n=1 Tax=Necator americanus TaxID=51031 RepID=W2TCW8_NECAM|nr:hypothetical protein NECAME_00418 [Necator americanus]ETN79041.1 hypothetical protein NECAME_00418 [Necator americanus]
MEDPSTPTPKTSIHQNETIQKTIILKKKTRCPQLFPTLFLSLNELKCSFSSTYCGLVYFKGTSWSVRIRQRKNP